MSKFKASLSSVKRSSANRSSANTSSLKFLTIAALFAVLGLAPGARAQPYSYEYTGLNFTNIITQLGGDYAVFSTANNVIGSITLDIPISSEGAMTDFSSHVTDWVLIAGSVILSSAKGDTLTLAKFQTTGGIVSAWQFYSFQPKPPGEPADWGYAQIITSSVPSTLLCTVNCTDAVFSGTASARNQGSALKIGDWSHGPLTANPEFLDFYAGTGQSAPPGIPVRVSSLVSGSTYTATSNQPWLTVSPSSNATGGTSTVTLSANQSGLAAGAYGGFVRYSSPEFSPSGTFATLHVANPSGTLGGTPFATGPIPTIVVAGDFNGDGKPDLVVVSRNGTVSVHLGDGLGKFGAAKTSAVGQGATFAAVGDFNGDGKLDLVVTYGYTVSVLPGDGSGGFGAATNFPPDLYEKYGYAISIAVGDFNGDGRLDIAVAAAVGAGPFFIPVPVLTVFLGDGKGGFPKATEFSLDVKPRLIAVGDFNRDGKLDLAVVNYDHDTVSVLLGNGSGSFRKPYLSFSAGYAPSSMAVGDFNRDGKLDLAIASEQGGTVSVLPGDGSGSFKIAKIFLGLAEAQSVVAGDFNGDGKLDLAVVNGIANTLSVLPGNGSGGFGTPDIFPVGKSPWTVAVADFNGDNRLDFAIANVNNAAVNVLLGTTLANTSLVLTSSAGTNFAYGSAGTLTATVSQTGAFFAGTPAPTGTVTFKENNVDIGTFTASPYTLFLSKFSVGVHNIAAVYTGDSRNSFSAFGIRLRVTSIVQTITFGALPNLTYGMTPPTLSATSNAPGANIVFTSNTSQICTASGMAITVLSFGTCSIAANSAATGNYGTASQVVQSFTMSHATQTIAFGALPNLTYGMTPSALSATSNAPGARIVFTSNTLPICTVSGTAITKLTYGTCSIAANSGATGNYGPASQVTQSFTMSKASQTIAFGALANQSFGTAPFSVGATATSGQAVQFASTTKPVCTVSGATVSGVKVTIVSIGTCTIQATQGGDTNYLPATPVNRSFAVGETQTIAFGVLSNQTYGAVPFTVSAAATSGLPVAFTSRTPAFCAVTASRLTLVSAGGTCTIQATQGGNARYIPAVPVNQSFRVTQGNPSASLAEVPGSPFVTGALSRSMAVGDFNGDGKLDLVVSNELSATVSVLLGDSSGSFGTAASFAVGFNPGSVVVGDFNGDGNLDLAIAGAGGTTVNVLLGNGLGGFGTATGFAVATFPSALAIGDFNGDGKLDLVVVNAGSNTVSVMLGDGSGGFATATSLAAGVNPGSVAVGDFNGDGKLDLAITNYGGATVTVLPGDGSGSFGTATSFAVGAGPRSVAVGDFNGDGNLDLAVANAGGTTVSVLLGDGSGSFGTATSFEVGTYPWSVAVGDFNGDGKLDLAIACPGSASMNVLLGNGLGSFGTATGFAVGTSPSALAIGDFNGDGRLDVAIANAGSTNLSVFAGTAFAATGSTLTTTAGSSLAYGTTVPLTATVSQSGIAFTGVPAPTGIVTFNDAGTAIGTATASPYTFSTSTLAAGSHTLTAVYQGDGGNSGSISNTISITVATSSQALKFGAISNAAYGTTPATLSATSNAPGASIVFASSTPTVCTVSGTAISLGSTGACTISANSAAVGGYGIAPQAVQSFTVTQKSLTPTISAPNKIYDGTTSVILSSQTLTGVVGSDNVTLGVGGASFASGIVATGATVTATGLTLGGTAAGNYQLSGTTATTVADITARALSITAQINTKPYDGTTSASATPIPSGLQSGDSVSGSLETYDTPYAGTGKTLTPTGTVSDGNGGKNYLVTYVSIKTGIVLARALKITATGVNKPYDGTTAATVTLADNRVAGDSFTDSYASANFASAGVGTGIAVTVTGVSISGTAAGNYSLSSTTASTTANITAVSPTITINSLPSGLMVGVDGGAAQATPFAVNLPTGSHTISAAATQAGTAGTQYVFANWSDLGAASHTITAGATPATYTAAFQTQYQLTYATSPAAAGTISTGGVTWVNAGLAATISATANAGYAFSNFSSGLTGTSNPQTVTINGPFYAVANFTALAPQLAASSGGVTILSTTSAQLRVNLTNTGLGISTNSTITSVTPINLVSGSGIITLTSGAPVNIRTIDTGGGTGSATLVFNWPSTATRVRFTVNFRADGGYTGSTAITVIR